MINSESVNPKTAMDYYTSKCITALDYNASDKMLVFSSKNSNFLKIID